MRTPTADEVERIAAEVESWAAGLWTDALAAPGTKVLVREHKGGLDLFLMTELLAQQLTHPVSTAGLPLGRLDARGWTPGLAALNLLTRAGCRRRALLSKEGAARFLYGKIVDARALRGGPPQEFANQAFLVMAPDGAAIGIGRLAARAAGGVEPVRDLGWYLREAG